MEGKDVISWEQKALLSELILGTEAAKKLHARLGETLPPSSSFSSQVAETNEILVKQILSSYEKSLILLNCPSPSSVQLTIPTPENYSLVPESPASINGSERNEEFANGGCGTNCQDHIFNPKKRKMLPKWTEKVRISQEKGLQRPQNDVFSWRKYGQKEILGAKFPRSYYRCTHRRTQNCWATKQVQKSDVEPNVFQVTYRGTHTCSQTITPPTPPPPASPEKQDTITQKPSVLLENLKTNDDVESSQIIDYVDWFNPTVEIDMVFPLFY